jgi:hypothetical protein
MAEPVALKSWNSTKNRAKLFMIGFRKQGIRPERRKTLVLDWMAEINRQTPTKRTFHLWGWALPESSVVRRTIQKITRWLLENKARLVEIRENAVIQVAELRHNRVITKFTLPISKKSRKSTCSRPLRILVLQCLQKLLEVLTDTLIGKIDKVQFSHQLAQIQWRWAQSITE